MVEVSCNLRIQPPPITPNLMLVSNSYHVRQFYKNQPPPDGDQIWGNGFANLTELRTEEGEYPVS